MAEVYFAEKPSWNYNYDQIREETMGYLVIVALLSGLLTYEELPDSADSLVFSGSTVTDVGPCEGGEPPLDAPPISEPGIASTTPAP